MKALVIAEKPSVARDIARVLHCEKKLDGGMEGRDYIVTWALGHLVTLADPEAYDKKYVKWEMETLPMMPDKMKLVVIPQTGKQFRAVKTLLFRKDVGSVVIATDAGREGELVARWILEITGCQKPIKRLWISSVTDKAIREGFEHLRDGREYDNLYRAAAARAEADWLVGINATTGPDLQIQRPAFLRPCPDADAGDDREKRAGDQRVCAEGIFRPDAESRRYPLELAG